MSESTQEHVEQLKKIIEFRKTHLAPVDTMGSVVVAEKGNPKVERFQILISLMLSSQTKDQVTSAAIKNLQQMKGGFNAQTLSNASPDIVFECIKKVGFAKTKTQYIIDAAKKCHKEYDDDIPSTLEELTSIKGVGTKMATLVMSHCWNKQIGIGVDVHVHRISNLLGWVHTKNANQTEVALQKIFPEEYWSKINRALVGFGQEYCTKSKPKCSQCPIRTTCAAFNSDDDDE